MTSTTISTEVRKEGSLHWQTLIHLHYTYVPKPHVESKFSGPLGI